MELKPIFDINTKINQTEYYWFQEGFTSEELEWVDNLKNLYPYEINSIAGPTDTNLINEKNFRIKNINYDDKSSWIYDKLKNFAVEANNTIWEFNLHSIIDLMQYHEYLEDGHYNWHVDIGAINYRKINIIVQLSDPDEYEGGNLELWTDGQFKTIPKFKGCVVLFPSFILHRVTPISKGIRKSLVLYVGGESYK